MKHRLETVVVLLGATLDAGCLASTYQVDRAELTRLAATDPALRAQRVRVTQELGAGAETSYPEAAASPPWVVDTTVQIAAHVVIADAVHDDRATRLGPPVQASSAGAVSVSSPAGSTPPEEAASSGQPSSRPSRDDSDDELGPLAVLAIAAGAVIGVGLAATEGARFDGWAATQPEHPIHIWGADGQHAWVPLNQLTSAHAAWADHALISATEGPFTEGERAPLDRVGGTYVLEGGSAVLSTDDGSRPWGSFALRLEAGAFPHQKLGFVGGTMLAFGATEHTRDDVLNARFYGGLAYMPLAIGRLHVGAFGEAGYAFFGGNAGAGDANAGDGFFSAAGLLAQIDWTTRLAVNLRAGIDFVPSATDGELEAAPALSAGFAVY